MTAIVQTNIKAGGRVTIEATTLGASDTFTYQPDANQYLVIENATAATVTPVITGSANNPAFFVPTYGSINLTPPHSLPSIAAGGWQITPLDTIRHRLGVGAYLTGCAGCRAMIIASENPPVESNLWIQGGKLVASGKLTARSRLF